jgi:hypothetical protein
MKRVLAPLVLVACARPESELRAKVDPTPVSAPSAVVTAAPSTSQAPKSDWAVACTRHLEAAALAAAKHSPALTGLAVESRAFVDGNGAQVEELSMLQLGVSLHVSRRTPPETGDDAWKMRAESLKGSYHRLDHRVGPKGSAFLAFDGVPVPAATDLAPIFRAAVDLCLAS